MTALLVVLTVFTARAAEMDTVRFTTRSNNGPEKDYVITDGTRWSVDAGGTLRVTAITDSSAQGLLYMELVMPGFGTRSSGDFGLTSTTTWKYGHNTGQVVICQSGRITISEIDTATNRMNATFQWSGKATLPSGVILNSTISKGSFSIRRTPQLAHDILPKNGVKWRPEERVKLTVLTRKDKSQQLVGNADVKIVLPPGIFEDIPTTKTSDGNGRAEWLLKVKDDAEGGDYRILVSSKKQGFDDSRLDTFKFKVDSTLRFYYGKCAGVPFIEFDAGIGEKWKDGGGTTITSTGTIKINQLLTIDGRVDIDTIGGGVKFSGDGKISIPAVYIDGRFQDFVFYDGAFSFPSLGCDAMIDFLAVPIAQQMAGSKLKELKLRLLGDFSQSAGAAMSVTIEGGRNMAEGCNDALPFGTVWLPNKKQSFTGEVRILDSLGQWYLGFTAKASNVMMGPSICVKEMSASYDGAKSEFTLAGKAKTPLFEEIGASVTFRSGELNKFSGNFRFDGCTPIPETPACFKGGSVSVENLSIGNPFRMQIASTFQIYGEPDLLELEIQGGLESPPNTIRATGILRMLNVPSVSATKPWQIEGSGSRMFSLDNYTLADSGTLKALHLGGDYFIDAKYTTKIGLKPDVFISCSGSATTKFPAMDPAKAKQMGMLGRFINGYAPVPIGTADFSMMITMEGERYLSANLDFRNAGGTLVPEIRDAIRAIGKGSIYVDFRKLPSPSAIVVDAGIANVLNGLFGELRGIPPGKPSESVQAGVGTFVIAEGETELIVMSSTTTPPADVKLHTPSGAELTASDPSKGIHRVMSPDGEVVLWVIRNPAPGTWSAIQPQGRTGDSIVAGVTRTYPDLVLTATQTGTSIDVSWNAADYPADARIAISADQDDAGAGTGGTGRILYTGAASVSPVSIPLSDSSAPCSFRIGGNLLGRGVSKQAKAEGTFTNTKDYLTPPSNALATTDRRGVTTISWSPIDNGFVSGVVVYRVDAGRHDVVTSAYGYETSFTFTMEDPEGAELKIAAVDAKGRTGCMGEAIDVVTDVREVEHRGEGMSIWLAPNPASDRMTVRTTNEAAVVDYRLVDIMGNVVLVQRGSGTGGTTLDLHGLATGTYVLIAQVGEKYVASTVRVVR